MKPENFLRLHYATMVCKTIYGLLSYAFKQIVNAINAIAIIVFILDDLLILLSSNIIYFMLLWIKTKALAKQELFAIR